MLVLPMLLFMCVRYQWSTSLQRIQDMLVNGINIWVPILRRKRAVIGFSSPNIAKEVYFGQSTIIEDTLYQACLSSQI